MLTEAQTSAPNPPTRQQHQYIVALDGVRGIAALLMLYCHAIQHDSAPLAGAIDNALLTSARLSWTGVDLFFVLSGFLLTGVLLDTKGQRNYFRNFFARRALRILPLYYFCLILFLLVLPLLPAAFSQRFGTYYASQAWYWVFLQNYPQAILRQLGYATDHLVGPTWPIAAGVQFFLLWPIVVLLSRRETLLKVCAAIFLGSMLLRAALEWKGLTYIAMYFTPCRIDGIAVGAAIALVARRPRGIAALVRAAWIVAPLSLLGIGLVLAVMQKLGYRRGPGYSPGYVVFGTALFSLLYGSLIALAVNAARGSMLERILANPLFRLFGKYSYSVYLLHMPVIILVAAYVFSPTSLKVGGTHLPGLAIFCAITFGLSLVVGIVTWHLLEKHFLRLRDRFRD